MQSHRLHASTYRQGRQLPRLRRFAASPNGTHVATQDHLKQRAEQKGRPGWLTAQLPTDVCSKRRPSTWPKPFTRTGENARQPERVVRSISYRIINTTRRRCLCKASLAAPHGSRGRCRLSGAVGSVVSQRTQKCRNPRLAGFLQSSHEGVINSLEPVSLSDVVLQSAP